MLTILLVLVLLTWIISTSGMFLWLGAKWLKIPNITLTRSVAAVVLLSVLGMLVNAGGILVDAEFAGLGGPAGLAFQIAELCGGFLISCLVIALLFRTSFGKAALAWLVLLIPAGLNLALFFFVIKPLAFEAFVMPTNSSAPALIGYHKSAPCPHCGASMVVPYDPEAPPWQDDWDQIAICRACLRTANVKVKDISQEIGPPDRFVCNKLLFPLRWDMAVFHPPSNPSVLYVKRLVGLPGEKIYFQDGAVLARKAAVEAGSGTVAATGGWEGKRSAKGSSG